jgi:hypothetical protein
MSILGVLALDVLAAMSLAALARRSPRRGGLLIGVALAVTVFELVPGPLPGRPTTVPEPYDAIADDSIGGAVLELPLQWSTGSSVVGDRASGRYSSIFMVYATRHGRPLVNGWVSRYPNERLARLTSTPVYRQILGLEREPGFVDEPVFGPGDLRALGIGYVVYHRDRALPAAEQYFRLLNLPVLADDGTVLVWRIPPAKGDDVAGRHG